MQVTNTRTQTIESLPAGKIGENVLLFHKVCPSNDLIKISEFIRVKKDKANMSKSPRAGIRVTALHVGLVRYERWKKFPKIIGLSRFLSHHCSFNLLGKGRCDWFLPTF